jgi:hypothetical protein
MFNRTGSDYNKFCQNIFMIAKKRASKPRPFLSLLTSTLESEFREADVNKFTKFWLKTVDKVAVDLTNLNFVAQSPRVKPHLFDQSRGLKRGFCVDIFLALDIKYDGTIQFCGQDSQNLSEHIIGTFPQISLNQAWRHPKLEAQRDLVGRSLGHGGSPICQNCYHNTDKYELFKENAKINFFGQAKVRERANEPRG